jgi:hypothetical protein
METKLCQPPYLVEIKMCFVLIEMQLSRSIFFFFTTVMAAASGMDLQSKVIHAVRETDCLQRFDYSGDLSTSNNENRCQTGGMRSLLLPLNSIFFSNFMNPRDCVSLVCDSFLS